MAGRFEGNLEDEIASFRGLSSPKPAISKPQAAQKTEFRSTG
jgi:hypothetical protein